MKSDVVFGLENAGWPALLVDGAGTICRANPAAVTCFGAALAGGSPRLATIWAGENSSTAGAVSGPLGAVAASKCRSSSGAKAATRFLLRRYDLQFHPRRPEVFTCCNCFPIRPRQAPPPRSKPRSPPRMPPTRVPQSKWKTAPTAGLRAATGAHRGAGFQQRADQHSRAYLAGP